MKEGAGRTLTYDNRATSIVKAGAATISVYDAGGQRVKKVIPGATTIYIGKLYECTNGVCTKYIFGGSDRIASIEGANTRYYHTDHLGSSSVITDQNGISVQAIYYYPYGEIKTNLGSDIARHKFTGQEWDAETGLNYYGARYYDPKLTRFVSADTIVPEPFNPQSLNRYSYVLNSPVNYIDPTGHTTTCYCDSSGCTCSTSPGNGGGGGGSDDDFCRIWGCGGSEPPPPGSGGGGNGGGDGGGNNQTPAPPHKPKSKPQANNTYTSFNVNGINLTGGSNNVFFDRDGWLNGYEQHSYNEILIDRSEHTVSFQDSIYEIRYGRLGPGKYQIDYIGTGFIREKPLITRQGGGSSYGTAYIGLAGTSKDIHGGGKGTNDPWAPVQGWIPTKGCYRMQNGDINALSVNLIGYRKLTGGYPIVRIQE